MTFGHDTARALAAVVDLINSAPADVAALTELVRRHTITDVPPLHEGDVTAMARRRSEFLAVFAAASREEAVEGLNAIMAQARITPRLTEHDDFPLHLHYHAPGATLAEHFAADGGVALATVLAAGEWERLRTCAAPGCANVFVDESRNRCRQYCDSRSCGNRLHVAAYRARRRSA
ncbi:CGNR zinc finger domain-containing protein [Bailinhaonella thermotolerans]|uniref:CGNR zinc finger domain-containing protein n=1 Tax=Bailinhaonella thermotolerans TaxID=1070861 RepID=A0A3A4A6N9_9ACTN|nr:CGNR zinc finger domain-containing protein [Bailinhaonella thermotolerans]RJL21468.1 CGNR zinc finger domain-containing protein [Bailinhaonella thermotolerans]